MKLLKKDYLCTQKYSPNAQFYINAENSFFQQLLPAPPPYLEIDNKNLMY